MVNNPNIRFAGFSDEWVQRKLGDYLTKSIEIKPENPSEIELLTVQLHHKGVIASSKMPKVTSKGRSYFIRHVGELIVGRQNFHNGGFGLVTSDVNGLIASSAIQSFDFKDNINPFFLISLMQRSDWLGRTEVFIGGTGQKEYSANVLLNLKIESTALKEQQKIGSIFSTLDHKIGLEERQIALLKDLKKGYLQKMFPKNGAKVPEWRFVGFADDWEDYKLTDVTCSYSGLTYSPTDVQDKGTFVLRSSNVKNDQLIDADNVYVNPDIVNSNNVKVGDVIVVVRNGSRSLIGKHAIVTKEMPHTVIGAFMSAFRGENGDYINALLSTNNFQKEVHKSLGATINQITGKDFSMMSFLTPNIDEQQKIGAFFKQLDDTIAANQRKLDLLKDFKKGLSQQLFV